jgi:hypothetical protein
MDSITLGAADLLVLPGAYAILAIMPRCDKQSNIISIYQVDKDVVLE